MMVRYITDSQDMNLSKLQNSEGRGAWCAAVYGVTKSQTQLTTLLYFKLSDQQIKNT